MILNILIVDDKPRFAKRLDSYISEFKSAFPDVSYSTIIIDEEDAYSKAKSFLRLNQASVDLLLVDFNIHGCVTGDELFKLIDVGRYLIYMVLHSVTTESEHLARKKRDGLLDDFCASKGKTEIREKLGDYEKFVLDTKVFGNCKFRDKYFTSWLRKELKYNRPLFGNTTVFDVLYAETDGKGKEQMSIYHRTDGGKKIIRSAPPMRINIVDFTRTDLFFKRVSSSMVINLLWVAKIDIVRKKIRFITMDSVIFERPYIPSVLFNNEVLPFLDEINSLHPFFRK